MYEFFLFDGHSCCCHVKDMSCTEVKERMSEKIKKLQFRAFFHQFHVGWFTVYGTGNRFSVSTNSNFEFTTIFNRFSR
jgi:hypothetical protein